jgi:hypothetical protein
MKSKQKQRVTNINHGWIMYVFMQESYKIELCTKENIRILEKQMKMRREK